MIGDICLGIYIFLRGSKLKFNRQIYNYKPKNVKRRLTLGGRAAAVATIQSIMAQRLQKFLFLCVCVCVCPFAFFFCFVRVILTNKNRTTNFNIFTHTHSSTWLLCVIQQLSVIRDPRRPRGSKIKSSLRETPLRTHTLISLSR